MRIKTVQIHNFSSFNKAPSVELNPEVSIILGKNESGKTSFLRAITSLKADYKYSADELCSYSLEKRNLQAKTMSPSDLAIIDVTFLVEPHDIAKLGEIHESLGSIREFVV